MESTFGCPNVISEVIAGETNEKELLSRVVTNVFTCFKNRGYIVTIPEIHTEEDISELNCVVEHSVNKKKCMIVWIKDEKIGVKHIKQIYDKMEKEHVSHCCMICKHPLTVFGKKAIEEFNTVFSDKYMEYFEYVEMLIDITTHVFMPKHIVLTPEEKEQWKKDFSIEKDAQCPKLYRTDAMARYYGLRKGDLVKIMRESEASTEYVTYRIVI